MFFGAIHIKSSSVPAAIGDMMLLHSNLYGHVAIGLVCFATVLYVSAIACHMQPVMQRIPLQQSNGSLMQQQQPQSTESRMAQRSSLQQQQHQSTESFSCCQTEDGGVPLDITLRKYLRHSHGFFIESGANNGLAQSNTLFFARFRSWKGVLIEPAGNLIQVLKQNRPESVIVHGALVPAHKDRMPVEGSLDSEGDLRGKMDPMKKQGQPVVGRSISSVLDEFNVTGTIDLWSLDVEGAESQALMGMDFARHRPVYILIEVWETNKASVFDTMRKNRYVLVPGIDEEGSLSGWQHYTAHRDFLWFDADTLLTLHV